MPHVRVMLCSPSVPTEAAQVQSKGPSEGQSLASSPLAMTSVGSALPPTFKPSSFSLPCTLQHSVTKSKLKPSFTARLPNPLCPTVAPQELGHGHLAFGGTAAPKSHKTAVRTGTLLFLIYGSKRRLAGRQDGLPPCGCIQGKMGQDSGLLNTSSSACAPIPSLAPACSMPIPAPSAAES